MGEGFLEKAELCCFCASWVWDAHLDPDVNVPSAAGIQVWCLLEISVTYDLESLTLAGKQSCCHNHWSRLFCRSRLNLLFSSVQLSRSVVSSSLRPHESQHTRPPCPSPTPGVHSDSCPSSQGCHPAISSSVVTFSSYPQSLPASESFPMSQLLPCGGQSTGASALASFLPKNTQG